MRRRALICLLLCLGAFPLFGDGTITVKGRVVDNQKGTPIPFATVVLFATEAAADSDKEGRFRIDVPEPGTYSLGVYAAGYEELKMDVRVPTEGEVLIRLSKARVSLDVRISEPREKTTPTESIQKEEIENTPTGGDPFEAINRESDVVKVESGILDKDYGATRMAIASALGFSQFAFITPFSYRSLPDYSNAFFLEGYIPLPFLTYPSISNAFSYSIFPENVVQSMDLYGGGAEPSLGPGAGLITSADVSAPRPEGIRWTWGASLLGAEAQAVIPVFGRATLALSLRKSYYEYTWLPLLFLLDRQLGWGVFYNPFGPELKTEVSPGSGDLLIHYADPVNEANTISVDVAACLSYTHFLLDRVQTYGDGGDHMVLSMDYLYLVSAAGASWVWQPSPGFQNTLQAFDSLYTTTSDSGVSHFSGEYYDEGSSYPYNIAGAKETVWFSPAKELEARVGAELRHVYGSFSYQVDASDYSFMVWEEKELRGQALSAFEASLWSDLDWDLDPFRLQPSVRLDWFSKASGDAFDLSDIRASPLLTATWYPDDASELILSLGQRCDRFDYFNWILFNAAQGKELASFWVTGQKSVIDEKYLMQAPARLSAAQGTFRIEKPGVRLGVLAYGYYMDRMSGFNYQSFKTSEQSSMYTSAAIDISGTEAASQDMAFMDADRMYSAGLNVKAAFTRDPLELTCNYTFGYSRIHLEETDEWMAPNSDITNYLKLYFHFPVTRRWSWDINANVACGIPATPSMLTYYAAAETEGEEPMKTWVAVQDRYNEMRDWMPRVTVNFQTEYAWDNGLSLFLDVANLLSFIHYDRPDPSKVAVGGVERSWLDRKYKVMALYMDYLLNIKVDFGLRYRPK